jgi:hypothetical protein
MSAISATIGKSTDHNMLPHFLFTSRSKFSQSLQSLMKNIGTNIHIHDTKAYNINIYFMMILLPYIFCDRCQYFFKIIF